MRFLLIGLFTFILFIFSDLVCGNKLDNECGNKSCQIQQDSKQLKLNQQRSEIRQRFVLKLYEENDCDESCVQNIYEQVKQTSFETKPAKCLVTRFNPQLRMLIVRCKNSNSSHDAFILNRKFKAIPGVKSSVQDALIRSSPSESNMKNENYKRRSKYSMFAPISRVELKEGFTPYNWGLDRIDEDYSPLDNNPVDFSCYPNQGAGVKVYVIDTGCKVDHNEFSDASITTMKAPGSNYKNGIDDHGHGSHIAGVVIGKNIGIARRASVTCIKAFNEFGNGAATDTINAVEYVLEQKAKNTSVPTIVNLSYSALTGFSSTALDDLVYSASTHGILFVVAAGNAAVNSCLFSPSKAEQAFTVTASTMDDQLEADSNIGPCVEFVAPGHEIVSAGIKSDNDYQALNGTSMATPHVVGLSALVLAEHPELQQTPATVRDTLYRMLVTSRIATVDNYTMPLMETGCDESTMPIESGEELLAEESMEPLLSLSESPSASPTPSESPWPSTSPMPSVISSPSPVWDPKHPQFWEKRKAEEMDKDLSGVIPTLTINSDYYHHGFNF